jgi:uncharacterized protein YbaR (Trm112 family)
MRLFLDEQDGASLIPCPLCRRPLLLAAERRGRWVVGYRQLYLRPSRQAMLVCSDCQCDHSEAVSIAATPEDAVIYSSYRAASLWSIQERSHALTLDELQEWLRRLSTLYARTGNPKLPSAYRFWRERFRFTYWSIMHPLRRHLESGEETVLQGKEVYEKGVVKELLQHGVLLERTDGSGTRFVRLSQLHAVYGVFDWNRYPVRFDFADGSDSLEDGNRTTYTPSSFAIVAGHRVAVEAVSKRGLCRVRTNDPEPARALGLSPSFPGVFSGEFPAGLVERCFRGIQFAYVQGFRLHLRSMTTDRDVFQLETRSIEAARALKMHRDSMMWIGVRDQLRWWRYFHRDEIERFEEKQIPLTLADLMTR